jgi:hypothetical protein
MYTAKPIVPESPDDIVREGEHEILDPDGDTVAVVDEHYVEGLLSHLNR